MKKIALVVGNGFDLANGLPTKYSDFLDFVSELMSSATTVSQGGDVTLSGDTKRIISHIKDLSSCENTSQLWSSEYTDVLDIIINLVDNNIWFKYFGSIRNKAVLGPSWIDFEKEISFIIQSLDDVKYSLNTEVRTFFDDNKNNLSLSNYSYKFKLGQFVWCLAEYDEKLGRLVGNKLICNTFYELREKLFLDLERLIETLNTYLHEFVDKKTITKVLPCFEDMEPSMILSFNYTHTMEKVFPNCKKVHYMHGECSASVEADRSNMVLGIDEYHNKYDADTNTDYVIFKKYVQRIRNGTAHEICEFLDEWNRWEASQWSAAISAGTVDTDELHIFGHSLDITDKDLLRRLFNISFDRTVIYCHNKAAEGQYIANLIKIIGQEELIDKIENRELVFQVL